MLQHGIGNFVWTSSSAQKEVYGNSKKFSVEEGRRKTNETPQGTGLGGAWKGSLSLYEASPLAGR